MLLEQDPTGDSNNYQNARGNGYEPLRASALVDRLELRKIAVARAAGSQVIEPLLRFDEWHLVRRDPFKNIRTRAARSVRIRELLKQTPAQCIQDALFISRRISLRVQTCLPLQTLTLSLRRYILFTAPWPFRFSCLEQSNDALTSFFQPVLELFLCRLFAHP